MSEKGQMGFNAMQPGKIKRGDILMLVSAVVIVGLVFGLVFTFVHF